MKEKILKKLKFELDSHYSDYKYYPSANLQDIIDEYEYIIDWIDNENFSIDGYETSAGDEEC